MFKELKEGSPPHVVNQLIETLQISCLLADVLLLHLHYTLVRLIQHQGKPFFFRHLLCRRGFLHRVKVAIVK